MPELKEVFEMVSQKVEPDADAWRQQDERHRRSTRHRRIGAFAVVAGIAVIATFIAVSMMRADPTQRTGGPVVQIPDDAPQVILDLGTGRVSSLPPSLAGGLAYAVSPDGTELAYAPWPVPIDGDQRLHIYVATPDGNEVRRLTPDPSDADEINPRWTPNGQILYQRRDARGEELGDLYLIDPRTGSGTRLTDLPDRRSHHWLMSPSVHPDGRTILFNLPRGPLEDQSWDLWTLPITGGEPTLLRRDAAHGSYSPSGTAIAYIGSPGLTLPEFGARSLWLADADGSDPRRLVEGTNIVWPRWSPDGSRIVYEDDGVVYVVDVSTGVTSRIVEGDAPEWLDEDTLILTVGD